MLLPAGRLTHGMLMGYDNPRMEGLWPTEEECPGFKYVSCLRLLSRVHACMTAQLPM